MILLGLGLMAALWVGGVGRWARFRAWPLWRTRLFVGLGLAALPGALLLWEPAALRLAWRLTLPKAD